MGVMLVLLLFSALVSASEVAFFSITPAQKAMLGESRQGKHVTILALLQKPKTLLATILIANNFINVAIIILSTFVLNDWVDFGNQFTLQFIVQVVLVTALLLLFGEIIPKIYAAHNNMRICEWLAFPMRTLGVIFYPISIILVRSTRIIDKKIQKKTHSLSVDDLSHALEINPEIATSEKEHRLLKGIVEFGDTSVRQIMKYRADVAALNYHDGYDKVLDCIRECGYSRLPVYAENLDNIKGMLYIKDLLPYLNEKLDFAWQKLIRNAFFVPENKKIDDLLKDFQQKKMHMAIVVDEYGGTSGIVTLEDILEEIVGDISDEFDEEEIAYSKLDEQNYIFEGKVPIHDFCRILSIEGAYFEAYKGESDTLAGLVIALAGRIPRKNEKIKMNGFLFTIEAADRRRVKRIKVTLQTNENSTH